MMTDMKDDDMMNDTNDDSIPKDESNNNNNNEEIDENNNLLIWMNLIQTMIHGSCTNTETTTTTTTTIQQQQPPSPNEKGYYDIQYGILSKSNSNSSSLSNSSSSVSSSLTTPLVGSVMVRTCNNNNTINHDNIIVITSISIQIGQPIHPLGLNQGDIILSSIHDIQNTSSNNNNTSLSSLHTLLQSQLQRILEENIPLQQLCILKGKMAYRLSISISILQNYYNHNHHHLFDIFLLSIVHALYDTKIPIYDNDNNSYNNNAMILSSKQIVQQPQQQQQQEEGQDESLLLYKTLELPVIPFSVTAIGRTCDQSALPKTNNIIWSIIDPCCTYNNNENSKSRIEDTNSTLTSYIQITIVFNVVTLTKTTTTNNPTTTNTTVSNTDDNDDDDLEILSLQIIPYTNDNSTSTTTTDTTSMIINDTNHGISINELTNIIHITQQYVKQVHTNNHIRIH